jgi:hypothetical protein
MSKEGKKNLIYKLITSRREKAGKKTKLQESICEADASKFSKSCKKSSHYVSGRN